MNKNNQGKKERRGCSVLKCYIIVGFQEKTPRECYPRLAILAMLPETLELFLALFGVSRNGAQLHFAVRAGHPLDANVIPVTNYQIEIHASLVQDVYIKKQPPSRPAEHSPCHTLRCSPGGIARRCSTPRES